MIYYSYTCTPPPLSLLYTVYIQECTTVRTDENGREDIAHAERGEKRDFFKKKVGSFCSGSLSLCCLPSALSKPRNGCYSSALSVYVKYDSPTCSIRPCSICPCSIRPSFTVQYPHYILYNIILSLHYPSCSEFCVD